MIAMLLYGVALVTVGLAFAGSFVAVLAAYFVEYRGRERRETLLVAMFMALGGTVLTIALAPLHDYLFG